METLDALSVSPSPTKHQNVNYFEANVSRTCTSSILDTLGLTVKGKLGDYSVYVLRELSFDSN